MKNNSSILTKLLLKDISIFQIIIYALGIFIGLFLTVVAFQFYRDFTTDNNSKEDPFSLTDYIVLSGKVNGLNFSNAKNDLTSVIEELIEQEWVVKASPFLTADFNITASVEFAGRGMSTALFFESVPDEFFDELPDNWKFNPEDSNQILPIIIPRDYLALYNFGFAATRGLPKIGEDILKSFPLTVSISGSGKQQFLKAKIVGLTSRLNTIAVPKEFIEWGNKNFGNGNPKPTRIIAEINTDPGDIRVREFIKDHKLELGGDKNNSESPSKILTIITSAIMTVGSVIALISISLLFVSLFLLIHKTKPIVYRLLALGFNQNKICIIYTTLFGCVNLIILVFTLIGLCMIDSRMKLLLNDAGFQGSAGIFPSILLSMAITCLITALCFIIFNRSISKNYS